MIRECSHNEENRLILFKDSFESLQEGYDKGGKCSGAVCPPVNFICFDHVSKKLKGQKFNVTFSFLWTRKI